MCRRTMKKSKSILSLLLTVILIVGLGFTVITGIGKSKTGAMKNIKLGLDLAGGVSITYQVKDKNPTKEEMSDTIYKLQKRVEQYSTEASVYQEGDDRINIEIPGVTDANKILDELGKPGSLSFQTADGETVLTGTDVKSASAKSGQDDMGNKEYSVELNLTKSEQRNLLQQHRTISENRLRSFMTVRPSPVRLSGLRSQADRLILPETLHTKKLIIWHQRSVSVD